MISPIHHISISTYLHELSLIHHSQELSIFIAGLLLDVRAAAFLEALKPTNSSHSDPGWQGAWTETLDLSAAVAMAGFLLPPILG